MKFFLTLALLATTNAVILRGEGDGGKAVAAAAEAEATKKQSAGGYGNEQDRTLQAGRKEAASVVAA